MKKLFNRLAISVLALASLWFAAALILIATAVPTFNAKPFTIRVAAPKHCVDSSTTRCFIARDGAQLRAQVVVATNDKTILLLHGIMSSSDEMGTAASALHAATGAGIVSLDLRGHGASAGAFGDIAYIGQYEDDVADVVAALRDSNPRGRLILAGHSMGGGIAMRYAAKSAMPPVDGYLLFAPHLGEDSPTARHEDASASSAQAPIELHLRRTIGLLMLNTFGITAFNGLGTLYFNVANDEGLLHYSFRAMASAAPLDYRKALRADDKPLLILAGSHDEAFDAAQYPMVAKLHVHGDAMIVAGETHDGILTNPDGIAAVAKWLR
jgi:pimeloyl-ACP methyl ester carboxylesterase